MKKYQFYSIMWLLFIIAGNLSDWEVLKCLYKLMGCACVLRSAYVLEKEDI